jgi:hypothetical protein
LIMGFFQDFFGGTPAKRKNVSTLRKEQEPLYRQGVNAGLGPGAGGAFGDAADYYRNMLSDNPSDLASYAAPALRQYNQDIVPGISEQFAGMGAGGLSSSGFRNAQIQGATDLAERIGQIRANLRQSAAQGLQNIGEVGLRRYSENMEVQPASEGFLSSAAPIIGGAIGGAVGGPAGAMVGYGAGQAFRGGANRVGANTSPYGNGAGFASPFQGYGRNPYAGGATAQQAAGIRG